MTIRESILYFASIFVTGLASTITILACHYFAGSRIKHKAKTEDADTDYRDTKLIPAAEAYQSTKAPELANTVSKINEARKKGDKYIIIHDKLLHEETVTTLTAVGYDVHVIQYVHSKSTTTYVYFNEQSSGKLTFENPEAKQKCNYTISRKDNFDIVERDD